jgi:hypothetical protein
LHNKGPGGAICRCRASQCPADMGRYQMLSTSPAEVNVATIGSTAES